MIITKSSPYTKEEIEQLKEQFDSYVKTVIDIENKVCSAGADRHFESETILLDQGSTQTNIWGGGFDTDTKDIDFNSFINIRPTDNNPGNEILDPIKRKKYDELTRFFFSGNYMNNKIAIESLSMDLYRVATGLHKSSYKMAKRFSDEAILRCMEIEKKDLKPYFAKIVTKINLCLSNQPQARTAEDALMYSVRCKNYVRKFLS